jgi:nitrogen fixation NifU-like protein
VIAQDAYSPQVWAHFQQPHGSGRPARSDFLSGRSGALKRGALVELWLRVEGERIEEARFEAFGCPATVAAASWLCQWLPGRTLAQALALDGLTIAQALEIDAARRGVALVVEDALKAALAAQ